MAGKFGEPLTLNTVALADTSVLPQRILGIRQRQEKTFSRARAGRDLDKIPTMTGLAQAIGQASAPCQGAVSVQPASRMKDLQSSKQILHHPGPR